MGSDNFNLSSRRFIESLIDILDKKNKRFIWKTFSLNLKIIPILYSYF
jgi:hypothetical protein